MITHDKLSILYALSPRELDKELREINGAIANERIWLKGSLGDDYAMHEGNLKNLQEERTAIIQIMYDRKVG